MVANQNGHPVSAARAALLDVTLVLVVGVVLSIYALLRFRGLWGEGDSRVFTLAIRAMLDTGALAPENGVIYPSGYAYQALAEFIMVLSGLSLPAFQLYGAALLMSWIVLPAWLAFRELTGTNRGATLATLILLVQPEFLFPILRGTHEKFTRGLMLCCFYLLMRSLRLRQRSAPNAGLLLAFYVLAYGMIAFNALLGLSFVAGTGIALVLCLVGLRLHPLPGPVGRVILTRLLVVTISLTMLVALFTFYIYPPAQHDLTILSTTGQHVAALANDAGKSASNPYTVVTAGWVSLPAYFAVSLADWLTLGVSAALWLWQGIGWFRHRRPADDSRALLLWAFYGAWAFLGVASIAVDVSGAVSGNFQQRIFPSFGAVAAPVIAARLVQASSGRVPLRRWSLTALGIGFGVLACLSVLKATNEPLLSNKWLFYVPDEMSALRWSQVALTGRPIWAGYDERLPTALEISSGGLQRSDRLATGLPDPSTRDFMVSDVIRESSARLAVPLPIDGDDLVTFDNGQVHVYHHRPRTPYQQ
jgi:hypothetical protein